MTVDASGALAGETLTQVTADYGAACALDAAGAAYCWGGNWVGQLGDGTTASSDTPVAVDATGALAGTTLTQVAAGEYSICALGANAAAYCWGDNTQGELGDGTTGGYSDTPVAVHATGALAGTASTRVTTGEYSACALDNAGAAYCWGLGGRVNLVTARLAIRTSPWLLTLAGHDR